jgi:hypothetical protein
MYRRLIRFFIPFAVLAMAFSMAMPAVAHPATARDSNWNQTSESPNGVHTVQVNSSASAEAEDCSSGPRTLSNYGDRVYPDQGNGGYTSIHTDLFINYDTAANLFLPGTHADLTIQSTQCLTDFSFDFERTALSGSLDGPDMTVDSVAINGQPATFDFRQPTYPGNPNGPDDPDPQAHAISNVNPVSASNPFPPACSPQVSGNSQNGQPCPANKLVITPDAPIPSGTIFTVSVNYTGRPGVHTDGDGSTEGWFRVNTAAAPNDGGFVTTEPVGNMAWMPLNNHPSAKPTYDIYDTVPVGKTAISAGELVGATPGATFETLAPTQVNPPDANFPGGSWTWQWHSPEPIASYLIGNSIASYDLIARTSDLTGIQYFQGQASAITQARKAINKIAIDAQEDLTTFQTMFNGPFPFTTNGVIVGLPAASFEEEMQTKITFAGGTIGGSSGTSLGTLAHENMHQWLGDNVTEAAFNLTFWKEGWATVGGYLLTARTAAISAGGLGTPDGDTAFDNSLINRFNTNYGTGSGSFWTSAPSNPTVGNLFSNSSTYTRPGTAYLALRQILDASASRPDSDRWIGVMKQIQSDFGGGSINEAQLEDIFHQWLPNQSAACHAKLDQFFTQWFDTAYPTPNNATNKPQITGPGINGPDHFYDDNSSCTRADQAITFDSLPQLGPDEADFEVSASSDSGLPVSFAVAGDCTISGSAVHLTGLGTCTITASQAGDLVFKPASPVSRTAGPNVTNDAPGGAASVQYSDSLNPTVTISASDDTAIGSTLGATASGLPAGFSVAIDSTSDDSTLPGMRTWKVIGATSAAPGSYPVTVTVTDGIGRYSSTSFTITVTEEDAEATYTGDMLAFTSPGGSSVDVLLRATVLDSSAVASFADAEPGDIRNATVTFMEGATTLCGPLPVNLLDSNPTAGTASCTTSLTLGSHQIDVSVNNYYTGMASGLVEVTEPDGSFITGGGYLTIGSAGGTYQANSGSPMNFGFNVKYKNQKNFQGHVNVIFRKDGKTYQIKSTAINSLGIALKASDGSACSGPPSSTCFGVANFRSKANLADVTNPLAPVSLGGNLTLQVSMTDAGDPGSNDTIGVTLWDGSKLLFASQWDGAQTVEQLLGGGNLVVH